MRGALDRCMWAAVARHVRQGPSISRYCTSALGAGRGRGRATPTPAPAPAPAAVAPAPSASPSASGIGHGSGGAARGQAVAGRGRGVVGRGIAEPTPAAAPSAVKGRGRGESPIVAARNASAGRGIGPPPTPAAAVSNAGSLGRGKEESKVVAAASINAKPREVAAAAPAKDIIEKPKKVAAASGSAVGTQQAGVQEAGGGNVGGVPAGGESTAAQGPSSSVAGQPQRPPEVNPAQNLRTSEASEVFAALIQSCVRKGLVLEIDYVYRGMQAAHISATLQTCQTLLETYIQLGNVQKMDFIYMEMREARMGHQKSEASLQEKMEASRTFSALIDSWHSRGFLEEVDLAYRGMKASQLSVGTHTYVALMDTYSRLGNFETMDMVYAEMRGSMTAPVSAQPVARGLSAAPPNFQGSGVGHGAPLQSPVMHHQQHPGQPFQGGAQYPPAQMQVAPPSYFQPGPTGYGPPQPQQVVQMQQWPQPNQTSSYPYMHSGQPLNMPGTYYGQGQPQLNPYANMQSAPRPFSQNMGYPQSSAPIHPQAQAQAPMYPGQPGYVQYQTGHPMAYPNAPMPPGPPVVPPNVSMQQAHVAPRPQFHAGAVTPGKQALPNAHVSPRPQGVAPAPVAMQPQPRPLQHVQATPKPGGLELQPKALELLQQSEYSKLIKEGMVAASGHPINVSRGVNLQPQSQVNQLTGQPANVTMVHPHLQAPQFAAPGYGRFVSQQPLPQQVPASMGVQYASVQYAPPVVHIAPPPTLQGQGVPTVRAIGHAQAQPRPIPQQPTVQVTPQPQLQRSVPTLGKPAMQPAPAKEPIGHPVSEPPVQAQPKPEPKQHAKIPALKLTPPKPEVSKVSNLKPASSKPETKPEPSEFSDATKASDVKAEAKPPPLKLELKAQVSKVADVKAEVESTVVESVGKVPSLKLSSVGKGKAVAASDNVAPVAEEKVPDLPKPPSLKLALGKKPGSPKQAEQPTKAAEDLESPRESTASVSDLELEADEPVAALPSIRRLTGRGRGKTVPTMDPAATILGLHAPSDALLQPEALDSDVEEQDESLPALPFQSRLAGKGRGKALPTPDPGLSAEQQKRIQLSREEAAKRAIAILESGVGKAQLSANLERRKKRFSDQFSFGEFPRRAVEARAGASSKKGKGKQKRLDGGEVEDAVIEYVAPEEYMERDVLIGVEEAIKGTLHRHFMLDLDPEAAMEEFGTNPDIDDKPLPTLEEMLEQAKPQIMSLDGTVDEQQWQDTVEDVKKRAPQLQSLVQAYAGPKKKTAKQKNKELHDIVSKLPPYASPELSAFTKRAMLTLQNNPSWSQNEKTRLLNRVVRDFSKF